eukprot:356133-Chlamydomonas_euryale.AAC.31
MKQIVDLRLRSARQQCHGRRGLVRCPALPPVRGWLLQHSSRRSPAGCPVLSLFPHFCPGP